MQLLAHIGHSVTIIRSCYIPFEGIWLQDAGVQVVTGVPSEYCVKITVEQEIRMSASVLSMRFDYGLGIKQVPTSQ